MILNPRYSTTVDVPVYQNCDCDESRKKKHSELAQQSSHSVYQILTQQGFLRVSLQTSYRSTISIILLARHLSKCLQLTSEPGETELGSDLEGTTPMFFDMGRCDPSNLDSVKLRLRIAMKTIESEWGSEVTVLYNLSVHPELQKMLKTKSREKVRPWQCYRASEFHGCEADKVFLILFHWY